MIKNLSDSIDIKSESMKFPNLYVQDIFEIIPEDKNTSDEEKLQFLIKLNKSINKNILKPNFLSQFQDEELLSIFREILLNKNLHLHGLKFFNSLLKTPQITKLYKKLMIHLIVARNIEKLHNHLELNNLRVYLVFIKTWITISYKNFPRILGYTLISLVQGNFNQSEHLKPIIQQSIELLRIIAIKNLKFLDSIDGIKILIDSILNKELNQIENFAEKISDTLIFLLDEEKTRNILINKNYFGKIFACFTDIRSNKDDKETFRKNETYSLATIFILRLFRSEFGIFFLQVNSYYIKFLIESLNQPYQIETSLFDLFDDLLDLQFKQEEHIQFLQLKLLIEQSFFDYLLQFSVIEKYEERAQELLQKFLKIAYKFIPQQLMPSNLHLFFSLKEDPRYFGLNRRSFISKIQNSFENQSKIIYNQQFMNYYIIQGYENVLRKNDFLYQIESYYFNFPVSFKDIRMSNLQNNIFNFSIQPSQQSNLNLLNSVQKNCQSWEIDQILGVLNQLKKNQDFLEKNLNKPLIKNLLTFFMPVEKSFMYLDWNIQNLKFIKLGYNFFETILTNKISYKLLEKKNAESLFIVYQSYMESVVKLFTTQRQYLSSSICQNSNKIQNKQKLFTQSFNLELKKNQKEESQKLFEAPLGREFFMLFSYLSYFHYGRKLLKKYEIFDHLKTLILNPKYDKILSIIILSLNYTNSSITIEFLKYALVNGSDFLKKICVNMIDLLIDSEEYDLVYVQFVVPIIEKLKQKEEKKSKLLKRMLISILEQMILNSHFDLEILKALPIEIIQYNKPLLYAFMKKQKCIDYLIIYNLIQQEFHNIKQEESQSLQLDQFFTPQTSFIEQNNFKFNFNYIHSLKSQQMHFHQTGFYKAQLLRYPWLLKINFNECQNNISDSNGQFFLNTFCYYDRENQSLKIEGLGDKIQLIKNFSLDDLEYTEQNWSLGICLFIGNQAVDRQLEKIQQIFFPFTPKNNIKKINDKIFLMEELGIQCYFEVKNYTLLLRKIILNIFLERNISLSKQQNPEQDLFSYYFNSLVQTKRGANFLMASQIFKKIINDLIQSKTQEDIKQNLVAIQQIAQSEGGVQILEGQEQLQELILEKWVNKDQFYSLRNSCYKIAYSYLKSETGRQILKKYNWNIYFVQKQNLKEQNDHYVTFKDSYIQKKDKHSKISKNEKDFFILYSNMSSKYTKQIDIDIFKKIIKSITDPKILKGKQKQILKNFESQCSSFDIDQCIKLFFLININLSGFTFKLGFRKFFWAIIDILLDKKQIFKYINSIDNLSNEFILNFQLIFILYYYILYLYLKIRINKNDINKKIKI